MNERFEKTETGEVADPVTREIVYTDEEWEFMQAVEAYKRDSKRRFPTWHEVLAILLSMGYRKVAAAEPLPRLVRQPHNGAGRRDYVPWKPWKTKNA